jgi:Ran GTPase-activating protein (RanGAP) involved in mRNA processing and transport
MGNRLFQNALELIAKSFASRCHYRLLSVHDLYTPRIRQQVWRWCEMIL